MSKSNFEVKDDPKSLNKPAWYPMGLDATNDVGQRTKLDGKYVFLQTRRAIYDRVLVARDSAEYLLIHFVKKVDHKTKEAVRGSDTVQKRDIEHIRVYKD